jgi:hypothetical protein
LTGGEQKRRKRGPFPLSAAGILLEEDVSSADGSRFVAIYFRADDLGALIDHLQAMQAEYEARKHFLDTRLYKLDA